MTKDPYKLHELMAWCEGKHVSDLRTRLMEYAKEVEDVIERNEGEILTVETRRVIRELATKMDVVHQTMGLASANPDKIYLTERLTTDSTQYK